MKTFMQFLAEMHDTDATERVRQAIRNLEEVDPGYFSSVFKQRSGKDSTAAGSVYDMNPDDLKDAILAANWRPYSHESIKPPAVGFSTNDLLGQEGMINLKDALDRGDLKPGSKIELVDPKNTGQPQPAVKAKKGDMTNLTVAMLGPHKGKEVIYTFHPGEPVIPSELDASKEYTVDDLIKNGILKAKTL
jgi:hypothetical protein